MFEPRGTAHRREPLPDKLRNRFTVMRFELEIPRRVWLSRFTREHIELLVEVHSTLTVSPTNTVGEFEIYGPLQDWTREISRFPDVIEVARIPVFPGVGRYHVLFREPIHLRIARKVGVHLRYPWAVRNGILQCESIARASEIRRLIASLQNAGCQPRVIYLRGAALRTLRPILTHVQRELFRQAFASGYYDVPRRITLTALAKKVSRSKSSVSRALAVVERKFAESATASGV
jgi:HTH DNA binding domain